MSIRILVADGDEWVRKELALLLGGEGYTVDLAGDGITAIKHLRRYEYHLMILDFKLPELDGRSVCRQLRKMGGIPFMILSEYADEETKLSAFDLGAEDYVVKPYSPKELLARIRIILRHSMPPADMPVRKIIFDGLCIDILSHSVYVDNNIVTLTPKEYQLLLILASNPNQIFSREMLLNEIWGQDFSGSDRTVDTHIKTLREALKPRNYYIATVRGFGYKFDEVYKK